MERTTSEKIANDLVQFLKTSFARAGFIDSVIALSGGVDSATSCALAVQALGNDHVFPILLPYGVHQGVVDAYLVVAAFGIPKEHVTEVDIKPLVDPLVALDSGMDDIRRGNIMARVRMIVLFDQAKKRRALVVGTENKSEQLLGYYTRFGDEASDIEPLRNLYKTQVFALAKHLGVPEPILTKQPTAGLWEGQTDEGQFGFTYAEADQILSLLYDEKKSVDDVVTAGWDKSLVEKVRSWVATNDFKHHLPTLPE